MLGIYESSIKKISFETGLKKDDVLKGLKEFERVNKVKYINNYVILINFMKHQKFNTNMKKSAIDIYNNLPKELKDSTITVCKSNPSKGFESLLKCFGMVSKIEVEDEVEDEVEEGVKQSRISFEEKKKRFINWFNQMLKKHKGKEGRFKSLSKDAENNYKKLIDAKYTIDDFEHAFKVMLKEPWVIKHQNANPSHFLRNDNFNRYLSKEYSDKPKINMV